MVREAISILAVDDEESLLESLSGVLKLEGYHVQTARDGFEAIGMLQTLPFDLILLDINMPRVHGLDVLRYVADQHLDTEVIMLSAVQDIKTAVECMKLGAFYYIAKPYFADDLLALMSRALEKKRMSLQNKVLKQQLARRALPSSIVGENASFLDLLAVALRAAVTDATVLVEGASGTGKEVVANFVHANSLRKDEPFLAVNCASLPETLLESELFGHERGAFTDAKTMKRGLVEAASGGTLFLDEIGEMALTIQPKLLRFLQTGEFRRVGGNKNLKSDVRVIAATNKNLRKQVERGRFREDLLYRINVISLHLPALAERKNDVPLFVDHFLQRRAGTGPRKSLDRRALDVLMKYDWPGNIRELENVIERAAVLSQDDVIRLDDLALPFPPRGGVELAGQNTSERMHAGSAATLAEMERAHVAGVLDSVTWNKGLAAKILGISIRTLYSKIQSLGLSERQPAFVKGVRNAGTIE